MTIDTSAVIAILRKEPERRRFIEALDRAPVRRMSAATYVETAAVADRSGGPLLARDLDDFIRGAMVEIAPFTAQQAVLARAAYRDFGKGSGHPARLNFGDCFAYALALDTGEPLLYKGRDFAATGIRPAVPLG